MSPFFSIAEAAHGYVGADLAAVCKEAGVIALKRSLDSQPANDIGITHKMVVTCSDVREAMRSVRPSALREVALDVPKVNLNWHQNVWKMISIITGIFIILSVEPIKMHTILCILSSEIFIIL